MIGSLAMALRYSFDLGAEADWLERAISLALSNGHRTADIALEGQPTASTRQMGDAVIAALEDLKA